MSFIRITLNLNFLIWSSVLILIYIYKIKKKKIQKKVIRQKLGFLSGV